MSLISSCTLGSKTLSLMVLFSPARNSAYDSTSSAGESPTRPSMGSLVLTPSGTETTRSPVGVTAVPGIRAARSGP